MEVKVPADVETQNGPIWKHDEFNAIRMTKTYGSYFCKKYLFVVKNFRNLWKNEQWAILQDDENLSCFNTHVHAFIKTLIRAHKLERPWCHQTNWPRTYLRSSLFTWNLMLATAERRSSCRFAIHQRPLESISGIYWAIPLLIPRFTFNDRCVSEESKRFDCA